MDISKKFEINTPADFAFGKLTDVKTITMNLPSNVVMRADSDHSSFDVGSKWIVRAQRTGRNFTINSEVTKVIAPSEIEFFSASNRIESVVNIKINPISTSKSQMEFDVRLKPRGLLGRILLQSLKASRSRIDARLDSMASKVSDFFETSYNDQD